jgi:hypothetical protein
MIVGTQNGCAQACLLNDNPWLGAWSWSSRRGGHEDYETGKQDGDNNVSMKFGIRGHEFLIRMSE